MAKIPVFFFLEDIKYSIKNKTLIKKWLLSAIINKGYLLKELNIVLCSDEYLLSLNQQFLYHDTLTDIITFDNNDNRSEKNVIGDLYISIERIKENAEKFKVKTETELHRVIIHGVLHLLGYHDKKTADKKKMTKREDYYLNLLQF